VLGVGVFCINPTECDVRLTLRLRDFSTMSNQPPSLSGDTIKVEVSATSVGLEVKGTAARRAAHALLDLISPFTKGAGWLGQQISQAQLLSAIRAAAKAREQLRQEGITKADIPLKILLPWLDGASLETDGVESLTDAWAGLFVRAAKSADVVTISYIDTLKKLGKDEAELLQFFATDTSPAFSRIFYEREDYHIFSDNNPLRPNAITRIENLLKKKDLKALKEFMAQWGFQGMCQIILFSLDDQKLITTKYFDEHEHVIANLEHLGLISIKSKTIETKSGNIHFIWFEITKYTFDLIWACQGVLTGDERSPEVAEAKFDKKKAASEKRG
jgi:hypothetical protein